jgi:SAM-dependent methyltransferase
MSRLVPPGRGPFDGVLQIVRYNWTLYVAALVAIALAVGVILLTRLPAWLTWLLLLGAVAAAFWLVLSLTVSYFIYDRSRLYAWEWIPKIGGAQRHIVNIHAGLDEASAGLAVRYAASELTILDIYDPAEMPEPSIARARQLISGRVDAIKADFRKLPLPSASADLVTLIFTAHELRRSRSREALFLEIRRILKPGAALVLVEHLRDSWNFIAFGPGAFHFLARSQWMRLGQAAGLEVVSEVKHTPFVRAFVFRQPPDA